MGLDESGMRTRTPSRRRILAIYKHLAEYYTKCIRMY
jgi:hypothetical protein